MGGLTISIHVPLAGDDKQTGVYVTGCTDFYPRPPCGGRRVLYVDWGAANIISIHVPLAGDDASATVSTSPSLYFYPRPPCGGRRFVSAESLL